MYYVFLILVVYILSGLSASITYHRIFTHAHGSYKTIFKIIFGFIALPAGTPVQWVGTHRQHHKFTDVLGDPHSPVLNGFWYAHTGWYLESKSNFWGKFLAILYAFTGPLRMIIDIYVRNRFNQQFNHLAKDIQQDKILKFYSNKLVFSICLIIMFSLLLYLFTLHNFNLGLILFYFTFLIIYNIGDGLNSIVHLKGEKIENAGEARNNKLFNLIAFGEGNHANHHANGMKDFDVNAVNKEFSGKLISVLKKIGIVNK